MARLNDGSQSSDVSPKRSWRVNSHTTRRTGKQDAAQKANMFSSKSHLPIQKADGSVPTEGAQCVQALPDCIFERRSVRKTPPTPAGFHVYNPPEASQSRTVISKLSRPKSFHAQKESNRIGIEMDHSSRLLSLSTDGTQTELVAIPTRIIRNLSTPNIVSIHRRPALLEKGPTDEEDMNNDFQPRIPVGENPVNVMPRKSLNSTAWHESDPSHMQLPKAPTLEKKNLIIGDGRHYGSIPRRYRKAVTNHESPSMSIQQMDSPSLIPRPINVETVLRHEPPGHSGVHSKRLAKSPGNEENPLPFGDVDDAAYFSDKDRTPTRRDYSMKHLSVETPEYGPTLKVHKSAERLLLGKPRRKKEPVVTPEKASNPLRHTHGYSPKAAQVLGLDTTPMSFNKDGPTSQGDKQIFSNPRGERSSSNHFLSPELQGGANPSLSSESSMRQESVDRNYTGFSSNNSSIRNAFRAYGVQLPLTSGPMAPETSLSNPGGTDDPFTEASHLVADDIRERVNTLEKARHPPTATADLEEVQRLPTMSSTTGEGAWISPRKKDAVLTSEIKTVRKPRLNEINLTNVGRNFDETYEDFIEDLKTGERPKERSRKAGDSPQSFPTRTSSLKPGVTKLRTPGKLGGSPLARTLGREASAQTALPLQDTTNAPKLKPHKRKYGKNLPSAAAEETDLATQGVLQADRTPIRQKDRAHEVIRAGTQASGSNRKGMLGTMRFMFQKRSRINSNDRGRSWRGPHSTYESAARDDSGLTSGEKERQRGHTHLEAMRRRAAASSGFPYIDNIPVIHRPTQRSNSPVKREPIPSSVAPLPPTQQHYSDHKESHPETPRNRTNNRDEFSRRSLPGEPSKTCSITTTMHRGTPERIAQAAQASLSQAEKDQAREADEGLDRTMEMARQIVKRACSEDSQSPRKQQLISLGQLMVESCAAARDSFKAVHEAKIASRRAEVAHALCLSSVRKMTELLEDWKGLSNPSNI